MRRERIVPQSEVIRAILLNDNPGHDPEHAERRRFGRRPRMATG